jgi:hypothetical protein
MAAPRYHDTVDQELWNPTSDAKNASDMGHPGFLSVIPEGNLPFALAALLP